MAATDNKRALPPKVAAMKARKRRKLEDKEPFSASQPALRKREPRKNGLKAKSLPWKDVSMPDHLDDYEGFFGLEEVDDVEVMRDLKTGKVSFSSNVAIENLPGDDDSHSDEEDPSSEWSGFEDDSIEQPSQSTKQREDRKNPHSLKPEPTRKKASQSQTTDSAKQTSGRFESLSSAGLEDDLDVSAWQSLKLSPDILASLARLKFPSPTPIQQTAIPEILAGRDVIGKASTGSGKTLAFGIPILEHFLETQHVNRMGNHEKTPVALILSPTRELAHQLDKHLTALCSDGLFQSPSIATLTGGLSLQKQHRLLKNADIVIATPGRLWEVMSEGQGVIEDLKKIQFLVVDEADRLLGQGHFQEVEEILNALDRQESDDAEDTVRSKPSNGEAFVPKRQTLVFSATFDRDLQRKLANRSKPANNNLMSNKESMEYLLSKLNFREEQPKFIDVNPINQLATGLKEGLIECAGMEKDLYLYTLLMLHPNTRTLVFTNSISAVRRLTPFLQNLRLPAQALHSGMIQKARLRSVERFANSKDPSCSILVATDVAARGLDIPNVQLVVHYHLPRAGDAYVHRSGRTARAGQPGSSILICAPEEAAGVRRLIAKVHARSDHSGDTARQGRFIRTLDLDRRIVSRLKPRATLAKKLADTTTAKEKQVKEDDFMRAAAEELGVDYDSDEFEAEGSKGRRGRGTGRRKKEKEARERSKADVAGMKAELKSLLQQRVNVGVSERYLTSGAVDVEFLLRQQEMGNLGGNGHEFLGNVQPVGLDDL